MRKTIVAVALMAMMLMATKGFGKHDGSYLHDVTMNFKTNSLPWCLEPAGGKPKALFIVPRVAGREVVELAQRMGLEFEAVTTAHSGALAYDDIYDAAVTGTSPYEKAQELLRKLEKDYDVIVLGNVALDMLPPEAQFKILSKVSAGTGLLMVYPRQTQLKKLLAKPIDGASDVLSLAPLAGLPPSAKKASPAELLKTYQFGKGNVAVLDYKSNHSTNYSGLSLTSPHSFSPRWYAEYENNMALLIRALLWTAGRQPSVRLECAELTGAAMLERGPRGVILKAIPSLPAAAVVEARLRDAYNTIIKTDTLSSTADKPSELLVSLPLLPAGDYFLDLIVRSAKDKAEVVTCGSLCFSVASPVGALVIETANGVESFKDNAPVDASLRIEKPLTVDATVEIELADSPYGRIWLKQSAQLKAGARTASFTLRNYPMPTIAGLLTCRLVGADGEIARTEKYLFFPKRKLEDFILMGWDSVPDPYLAPSYAQQTIERLGWRAGLAHPSPEGTNARLAAIFNQRQVTYTVRVGLRNSKEHNGWTEQYQWFLSPEDQKSVKDALQGDQSIYNPKAKEYWRKSVEYRIKNLPLYGPAIYSLGDENFFDYNSGFAPSEEKEFKSFLKGRYGTIGRLNEEWGTTYASFEDVKHFTMAEAKEAKNFPAWFDHRKFMERQYADVHHYLAEEITKIDPDAIVGAEGSVPGDLEESITGQKFWGPYSDLIGDELLRSIGGDRVRMLWWGGYVGSHGGREDYPLPLWKDLLRGNVNGSAWFSTHIGAESCLGADQDFPAYVKKLLPHLDDLNDGVSQLLVSTPLAQDGVALLWSHASDSAALLDPRCVNPKDSLGVFTHFSYATGIGFDYLTESGVGALASGKYRILFLFGASAVSKKTADAIADFAKAGGIVVADLNPGILNDYLRPLDTSSMSALFGDCSFGKLPAPVGGPLSVDATLKSQQLRFAASKALQNTDSKPFSVKDVGKGKAVLLGFTLGAAESTVVEGTSMKEFLRSLLAAAGVTPRIEVRGLVGTNSTLRVRCGDGFSVVGLLADKKDWSTTATFAIPKEGYVYEVNKGPLGKVKEWTAPLTPPLKLYSVFEKEASAPAATLSAKVAPRGYSLTLDLAAVDKGAVLLVRLLGPDGGIVKLRDQVVTVRERNTALALPFAYTDTPGDYILLVRDIRTGLETTLPVRVE